MADSRFHPVERDELAKIDYFLEQVAKAIEHGDIPFDSYDRLAPRYLDRRAELVDIIFPRSADAPQSASAAPSVATASPAAAFGMTPYSVPGPEVVAAEEDQQVTAAPWSGALETTPAEEAAWARFAGDDGGAEARSRARAAARSAAAAPATSGPSRLPEFAPREPVPWTTALLFVGAFLMIVATATFAFWAWDRVGPVIKLGSLMIVTAGFYVGGWYVREKLSLRAGGAALTVVASAMLLFCWWIAIDGFDLPRTMGWSIALLVSSVIYWASEVLLGEGYYGIAGAAGQVGWWWLMASGLHFERAWQLAGLAIVAMVWQLTAEFAQDSENFGSLSRMLQWAAPAAAGLVALASVGNTLFIHASTVNLAVCGAIVSVCGAVIAVRTRIYATTARYGVAAALQVPFLAVLVMPGEPTWPATALLAAAAAAYGLYALLEAGMPFVAPALFVEVLTVASALQLLHVDDRVKVGVGALVGLSWIAAGRLAAWAAEDETSRLRGAADVARAGAIAGFALLALASLAVAPAGDGVPLTGAVVGAADVTLAAVVLAAWAASSLLRRRPEQALATVLWSFYATAALLAWSFPGLHSAVYAIVLLALAAAWLATREPLERFYSLDERITGATTRVLALGIVALGIVAEQFYFGSIDGWQIVLLPVLACAVFLTDAVLGGGSLPVVFAATASVFVIGQTVPHPAHSLLFIVLVLAEWIAAAVARREPQYAAGAALWSFYVLIAMLAAAAPRLDAAYVALAWIALAGAWLAARFVIERSFDVPEQLGGWVMRSFTLVACVVATGQTWLDSPQNLVLRIVLPAIGAAAFFLADAVVEGPVASAAIFGALAVGATWLASTVDARFVGERALAIAVVAAVLGVAGGALRTAWARKAQLLALAPQATVLVLGVFALVGEWPAWPIAAAFGAWAIGLAAAGWAIQSQEAAFASALAVLGAVCAGLAASGASWPATLALVGATSAVLGLSPYLPAFGPGGELERVGRSLSLAGGLGLAGVLMLGVVTNGWVPWLDFSRQGYAVGLVALGAYAALQGITYRMDTLEYVGWGLVLAGSCLQLHTWGVSTAEYYSTPVAAYAVAMGYLYSIRRRPAPVPVLLDALAVIVGLGVPVAQTLLTWDAESFTHLAWAVGLSVLFIAAGIFGRVRWYLYGGIVAIVIATGWKAIVFLAGLWWVILGLLGMAAILIALTWERQRQLFADAALRLGEWR